MRAGPGGACAAGRVGTCADPRGAHMCAPQPLELHRLDREELLEAVATELAPVA